MIEAKCQCGVALRFPDHAAGKTGKCPKCGSGVTIPAAPLAPSLSGSPSSIIIQTLNDPRANLIASLFWLALGYVIARWAPWLGLSGAGVDELVNFFMPLLTFALICWNLYGAVGSVSHRRNQIAKWWLFVSALFSRTCQCPDL